MRELSLEEIKQTEYAILCEYAELCNKLNLRYSLGGGTLLGAVRHKGFIPWDDDIDVIMPRNDYDQFVSYCATNKTSFSLITYELSSKYMNLFAKVFDPKTCVKDESIDITGIEMGISIDVFPIDGLGNSYQEALKKFNQTALRREILNAKTWKHYFISKTHPWYYEPFRLFLFIISRFCNASKLLQDIDRSNRATSFKNSQYAGCVCGVYRKKEIMKKETFDNYIKLDFEKNKFSAISDYDTYLTKLYGNYMELPPAEKRVTHHTVKAFER